MSKEIRTIKSWQVTDFFLVIGCVSLAFVLVLSLLAFRHYHCDQVAGWRKILSYKLEFFGGIQLQVEVCKNF